MFRTKATNEVAQFNIGKYFQKQLIYFTCDFE